MNTLETLKAMDALLDSPERWTVGKLARDVDGQTVKPNSAHACQWCLSGAAMNVLRADQAASWSDLVFEEVCGLLSRIAGTYPIPEWNDAPNRTFAEVKDLLARAIAAEEPK